jgi:hypothetical protein
MEPVNRMVVIIRPEQPFIDWINETPELALTTPVTLEEIQQDCDVVLVPVMDSEEEVDKWLELLKPRLLEMQLESWSEDRVTWPEIRSSQVFDEWCRLEFHSMVWDLADQPIYVEPDDFEQEGDLDELYLRQDKAQQKRIRDVLRGIDERDRILALDAWSDYLSERLEFPFEAKVVEYGGGGQLRVGDRVAVLGFGNVDDMRGILVQVQKDWKELEFPLDELEVVDRRSPNFLPVEDYAVWFVYN